MQFVLVDGEFDSNLFFLGHLQSLGIRGCLFGLRIAEQCLLSTVDGKIQGRRMFMQAQIGVALLFLL